MTMFRVKICGVTRVEDALVVAASGADAIGLNFFPPSPRFVDLERAREITAELPDHLTRVGVFVNAPIDVVRRTCEVALLDVVQLHGDETPEFLRELSDMRLVRAIRCRAADWSAMAAIVDADHSSGVRPEAYLIDAHVPGQYGGTGETVDWDRLAKRVGPLAQVPIILAGGLIPENVGAAIRLVRPAAVDTASGVESAPGIKDPALVRAFVDAAFDAYRISSENGGVDGP
ncbi:MAG: phosphoribosylanthranilate isomerase [Planctomycetales bacterium]|nr:phosphoribosylanthranilate isomerase [Planctomycetales bacterium]